MSAVLAITSSGPTLLNRKWLTKYCVVTFLGYYVPFCPTGDSINSALEKLEDEGLLHHRFSLSYHHLAW